MVGRREGRNWRNVLDTLCHYIQVVQYSLREDIDVVILYLEGQRTASGLVSVCRWNLECCDLA